jgi:Holliday junction resolvase-like predicted endonuclease|tara:strand:- start:95 stop:241 length:147 start_codon:yes stop_codon:yes gene_type:complete
VEIDIIAKEHDFFVFVEVKCRPSNCVWLSTNFCFRKKQAFFIDATEGY